MRRARKVIRWGIIAVLVLVGAVLAYVIVPRGTWGIGGVFGAIDSWIARQVARIAETYLVPRVDFVRFEYHPPGTVILTDFTLTSPDGIEVVRAGAARLTLAGVPRVGSPIVIESIELESATLRLLRQNNPDGSASFKGLLPLVKTENIRNQESVDENVRLSRVFQIRRLKLRDGGLEFDDGSGRPPMQLRGVTIDTGIEPVTGKSGSAEDGWYRLQASAGRAPLLSLDFTGQFNIDSLAVRVEQARLAAQVGEETYSALPPRLQQTLRDHDAQGSLQASASGDANLRDWGASTLTTSITLERFNIASGKYRVPIDRADLTIDIRDARAMLQTAKAHLLEGSIQLSEAAVRLDEAGLPASGSWQASDLQLRDLLRATDESGATPELNGRLASQGSVTLRLDEIPGSISGSGTVAVREARLTNLPLLRQLSSTIGVVAGNAGQNGNSDTADFSFNLDGSGVNITSSDIQTPFIAAKGSGTIAYSGQLDMMINAGPLQKAKGALGKIGDVVGIVTDQLIKYHVTGVLGDPQVRVSPLGL